MKKITTLFKKDPNDLGRVINEVNPENEWVFTDDGVKATRKFDGTACAIINGELYKRYDVKKGREVPVGAIPCQEPDLITGHWPHWVKCESSNPADKYFFEALDYMAEIMISVSGYFNINEHSGTYELCGPKINGNKENYDRHTLVRHGSHEVLINFKLGWNVIKSFLSQSDSDGQSNVQFNIEGIVFHHPDGRMCKIRKSDFGIRR